MWLMYGKIAFAQEDYSWPQFPMCKQWIKMPVVTDWFYSIQERQELRLFCIKDGIYHIFEDITVK